MGNCVSVTVTERKVDEKRRVTLPQVMEVKEGSSVVMIASRDATVVASNRAVAERLSNALRGLEKEEKLKAIEEWAEQVKEAGLTGLRAKDNDRLVGETMAKKVFGRDRKVSR